MAPLAPRTGGEERLERASLALAAAATLVFCVVLWLRGIGFAWRHSMSVCGPILMLVLFSLVYRTVRRDLLVARITFALAVQIWTACIVGGICLAALGWQLPFVDHILAGADHALGLDVSSFTTAVAQVPLLAKACGVAYVVSSVTVFGAVICLTLLKRSDRIAELGFIFVTTILSCSVVGIFFPAVGAFTYLNLPATVRHLLPEGSGIYYMAGLQLYRSGAETTIDFTRLVGVITFPSFHTCMALMVAYAFRAIPKIFWPMVAFNLLVGISIIIIGGHYVIDIFGGVAVFAMAAAVAAAIGKDRSSAIAYPDGTAAVAGPHGIAIPMPAASPPRSVA